MAGKKSTNLRAQICSVIEGCPPLDGKVENGKLTQNNNTFNGKATLQCNSGHQPSEGQTSRVCQENKQWSGKPLKCDKIIDCPRLYDNVANGTLVVQDNSYKGKAILKCDPGFQPGYQPPGVNRDTRVCQANGQWSGNPLACERTGDYDYIYLFLIPIKSKLTRKVKMISDD